jgi:hypothetical protein
MSSGAPAFAPAADRRNALDRAHSGDIEGAFGTRAATRPAHERSAAQFRCERRDRNRRPPEEHDLTPWQRRTWIAPMLEMVRPPRSTPARTLALGLLRGYVLLIVGLLLLSVLGVLPAG